MKMKATYQIWPSGSDDEEMRNTSHGAMFVEYDGKVFDAWEDEKFVKSGKFKSDCEAGMFAYEEASDGGEKKVERKCLMATTSKSPITEKVHYLTLIMLIFI